MSGIKTGIYVCHCGGNISDIIDVKEVVAKAAALPGVAVAREYAFMCSDPGQGLIVEDIRAGRIDRVVVAACSPTLHELTFRNALKRAGINQYLFEHINIREQASWVHKSDKAGATAKAIRLVASGAAKVALQGPLENLTVDAMQAVAVIGGGAAGMQAALALSAAGFRVSLIEKTPVLGGKLLDLDTLYPDGEKATDFLAPLCDAVANDKSIVVHCECEVEEITGFVGNFKLRIGKDREFVAGAIVIATGFENYQPRTGEMGFGDPASKVITLPGLHAILKKHDAVAGGTGLTVDGRTIESIAFVHCVGSRQAEGIDQPQADGKVNDYCSRVCCTATLHAIREITSRFPGIRTFDVYRDIRAYGRGHEEIYEKVAQSGTIFFRHEQDQPPVVKNGSVTVKDVLTWNETLEIPADLFVLATGMMPHPISKLVEQLRLPRGSDRFLLEAHPKLRPVEIASSGIFLAGTCQGPMDVRETSAAARAAASKVSALLCCGKILLDPFVARVNHDRCDGCGLCLGECSYPGAITLSEECGGPLATVCGALCKGCGACVAVCPHRAIEVAGWSLDQFDAMVDAIVAEEA